MQITAKNEKLRIHTCSQSVGARLSQISCSKTRKFVCYFQIKKRLKQRTTVTDFSPIYSVNKLDLLNLLKDLLIDLHFLSWESLNKTASNIFLENFIT